jgi:hypothetical protein
MHSAPRRSGRTLSDPDVTRVAVLVELLRRIPDEFREFVITGRVARRRHGMSTELVDLLVASGLPTRDADGSTMFDNIDLLNVAMHLGISPWARAARRFWSTVLGTGRATPTLRYFVEYQTSCPDPGHDGPCRYTLTVPEGQTVEFSEHVRRTVSLVRVEIVPETVWPVLPDAARELVDAVLGLRFVLLPGGLRRDTAFARTAGICDCNGTAALLGEAARRLGVTVRSSYGFLVTPPFSSPHSWVDVLVDNRWVPVDPTLVTAMLDWGVLSSSEWSAYDSPGAVLVRVGASDVVLAAHAGVPVPVMLATSPAQPGFDHPVRVG